MDSKLAHQILLVDKTASFDEVKYSYRKLVLELHPDKNKNKDNGMRFKKITDAYHFIKNQKKHSNNNTTYSHTYQKKQEKQKGEKFYRRSNWGPGGKNKTPEENWSRFTHEFEENKEWWKQYEKKFWEEYDTTINQTTQRQEPQEFKSNQNKAELGVQVDESLCIGCCSCETITPEVFSVDKTKQMNPKSHVRNRKGASNLKILNAAETCPTKAILVDDLDTGKRIFPY